MSLIQGGSHKVNTTAFYPTTIDQSLRFEDGDSAYLTRSLASSGSLTTWTWSCWIKRGNVDTLQYIFNGYTSAYTLLRLDAQYRLEFLNNNTTIETAAVFRDPSAWYHIVLTWDSSNATADDRVRLYVNGERISTWQVTPRTIPQNEQTYWNRAGQLQMIGTGITAGSNEFDGYMAEVHFTDGTAYDADDFGELKSGIWVPKDVSVTYGTNGFKLTFEDSAAIGDDTSGNGNDWTVNNFVASDVVPDSPTNNFNVMNPALYVAGNNCTYSEGNLKVLRPVANWETVHSTMAVSSGKWYWEVYIGSTNSMVGVCDPNTDVGELISVYTRAGLWNLHLYNGDMYLDGGGATTTYRSIATGTTGDVISVALDADNGRVYFGKNGTWFNSGDPVAGTGYLMSGITSDSGFLAPTLTVQAANDYQIINFGQDDTFAGNITTGGNSDSNGVGTFKYTVPTDYLALCTSNLPDPVIDPAQDATPEDHFNVITYSGTTSSPRTITGVGFEPDFVWVKNRTSAYSNILWNVVSGDDKVTITNTTASETATSGDANGIISTNDADGFVVKNGASSGLNVGSSGSFNYVAWNWKAGGTGVSNTDGSITSTVSANTDAGFSIVGWTGNGTDGATLGHGLTAASPELIIFKNRDVSNDWFVMGYPNNPVFTADGSNLRLNTTAALTDSTTAEISIGSSVVTFVDNTDDINGNGDELIAYCFHSVDGYSKVGGFSGNNSTDGPFVYTGFRPKWVMFKNAGIAGDGWDIRDAERSPFNDVDDRLFANLSNAESADSTADVDFLSNGFKIRTNADALNESSTYIYLAFAEQPFKYSNAR